MKPDQEAEIRRICTYYSELGEGTAGYDLSEEQFQKLFKYLSQEITKAKEELLKTLHRELDNPNTGYIEHNFLDDLSSQEKEKNDC